MLTTVIFVLAIGSASSVEDAQNLRSAEANPAGGLSAGPRKHHKGDGEAEVSPAGRLSARPREHHRGMPEAIAPIEIIEMAPEDRSPFAGADAGVDAESYDAQPAETDGRAGHAEEADLRALLPEIMQLMAAQQLHSRHEVVRADPVVEEAVEGGGEEAGSGEDASAYAAMRLAVVRIQSVVKVKNLMKPYSPPDGEESFIGTGFIVKLDGDHADPLIVTNAHVVSDASAVCTAVPAGSAECYPSQVRLINHDWDLAVLRVTDGGAEMAKQLAEEGKQLAKLDLIDPDEEGAVKQGTKVFALGFPLGKDSLALTSGTASGSEVVGDNVQLQQDAPISPGNSGGPLVLQSNNKVVGVNFASAVAQGSQNNNFAIPAFRVVQMMKQYMHHKNHYSKKVCTDNPGTCSLQVPSTGATVVRASDVMHEYYGCDTGALVTKVANHSAFASADPPVVENSFITKVGGIALDRFGMGTNDKYMQDKVKFNDLLFMNKDLDQTMDVETCSCGKLQTHTVSHEWKPEYDGPMKRDNQPNVEERDFVHFANVTFQPLTKSLAHHLILEQGMMQLIPYVMEGNLEQAIVITDVGNSELAIGGKKSVSIGGVVDEINGKKIKTFSDIAKSFRPGCHGQSSCSGSLAEAGDVTTTVMPGSFVEDTTCNRVWTLKTKDGKFFAANYKQELLAMKRSENAAALNKNQVVQDAMTQMGITVPSTLVQQEDKAAAWPTDPLPIEYRKTYRGGMTVAKALEQVVTRGTSEGWGLASSFLQMGPGGLGPGGESLLQLGKAAPSSFLEMGPGGLAPESLLQLPTHEAGRGTHART